MDTQRFAPAADEDRILFLGTFASAPLEQAYRARYLRDDLWIARVCMMVAITRISLCAILDYLSLPANVFLFSLGCRLVFVLLTIWALLSLRSVDRLFFAWCLLLVTITTCFMSLQMPIDSSQAYMTLAIVLAAYAVVPLPLLPQMLGAIPFSIAVFGILMTSDKPAAVTLGAAFVLVNTLGIVISTQLNRRRRQGFLMSLREAQLRSELEQALAEVKTLRGLIPICAWCKKVRDEDNAWQTVEAYVRQHTYAEFSHGMCPSCVRAHLAQTVVST